MEDGQKMNLDPFFNNSIEELDQQPEPDDDQDDDPKDKQDTPDDTGSDDADEDTDDDLEDDEEPEDDDADDSEDDAKAKKDDGKKSKTKKDDWKTRYDAAEEHRKTMQSERDMLRHQVNQQIESIRRIEQRLEHISTKESEPELPQNDDALLTVGDVKKLLKGQRQAARPQQEQSSPIPKDETEWAYSQDDFEEVNKYAIEKGLQYDPQFNSKKTNLVGRYEAVRALIAKERMAALTQENRKLAQEVKKLKKKTKPKMPTIGAGVQPAGIGRAGRHADGADRFWGS